MKNNVPQRGTGTSKSYGTTIHISKTELLMKLGTKGYTSAHITSILAKVPGSHHDFRSSFIDGNRVHCIKIPRVYVDQEILAKIDKCKCDLNGDLSLISKPMYNLKTHMNHGIYLLYRP